jgi:hypothetical protein
MNAFGTFPTGERRSAVRRAIGLVALVSTLRETRSAIVVDLSANGARLRGKNLPSKWTDMFVHVAGVIRFGTVQWEDGDERGIFFDLPLDADDQEFLELQLAGDSTAVAQRASAAHPNSRF